MVYTIGPTVAIGLLLMIGNVEGDPTAIWVQKSIVLGFPTAVGASGARLSSPEIEREKRVRKRRGRKGRSNWC